MSQMEIGLYRDSNYQYYIYNDVCGLSNATDNKIFYWLGV